MTERIIRTKYKTSCVECHYTIWRNERIRYDGKARHVDCLVALNDETPRQLDERWMIAMGRPAKGRVAFRTGSQGTTGGSRSARKRSNRRLKELTIERIERKRDLQ